MCLWKVDLNRLYFMPNFGHFHEDQKFMKKLKKYIYLFQCYKKTSMKYLVILYNLCNYHQMIKKSCINCMGDLRDDRLMYFRAHQMTSNSADILDIYYLFITWYPGWATFGHAQPGVIDSLVFIQPLRQKAVSDWVFGI